jgi:RNA polymerase-binding transcription factor DksA
MIVKQGGKSHVLKKFERRLGKARHEVWCTIVGTDEELATLEAHQAGAPVEDVATDSATAVLSRLDGAERHLLDEIDAAQARLAAGTYGACERCGTATPVARLRALSTARLCIGCERVAERAVRA